MRTRSNFIDTARDPQAQTSEFSTSRRRLTVAAVTAAFALAGCAKASPKPAPAPAPKPKPAATSVAPSNLLNLVAAADIQASVILNTKDKSGNVFGYCSATRVGATTILFARHCLNTSPEIDSRIDQPYDVTDSPNLLPAYEILNNKKITIAPTVIDLVKDPAGEDIAIANVDPSSSNLKNTSIMKLQSQAESITDAPRPGDLFTVSGYPRALNGLVQNYTAEYLGIVTGIDVDGNYADPQVPRQYQAFALPPKLQQTDAADFCNGGGMSGSAFVNDQGEVTSVLSNNITPGRQQWSRAAEALKLTTRSVICLAAPVNQELINSYEQAASFVPPASQFNGLMK